MTVTTGHFTLSKEQQRFKQMLQPFPRLAKYWNFETRDCDLESIEKDIGALSSGEQHLLRFFVNVWLGENRFDFDLIDAIKTVDETGLSVIQEWVTDPFYP